jgi:DNA-directed RNA polymerase subunit alpha
MRASTSGELAKNFSQGVHQNGSQTRANRYICGERYGKLGLPPGRDGRYPRSGATLFLSLGREPMGTRIRLSAAEEASRSMQQRLDLSTAEIGLTVRTTNCLEERGIFTVRDLLNCTADDLLSISNFGEKTLEEVYLALEKFGFYRPMRNKPR